MPDPPRPGAHRREAEAEIAEQVPEKRRGKRLGAPAGRENLDRIEAEVRGEPAAGLESAFERGGRPGQARWFGCREVGGVEHERATTRSGTRQIVTAERIASPEEERTQVPLEDVVGDLSGDDGPVGHEQVGVAPALFGRELEGDVEQLAHVRVEVGTGGHVADRRRQPRSIPGMHLGRAGSRDRSMSMTAA